MQVGGENRWAYSSFKNWRFFPGRDVLAPIETPLGAVKPFPFLVYFKETQTPQDKSPALRRLLQFKLYLSTISSKSTCIF